MTSKRARSIAVALLMGFTISTAQAMAVSPIHVEMRSAGNAGRTQITVTNNSASPLPVDTSLAQIDIDQNGVAKSTPVASDEFLVFPPQAMIPAGGTQVFRVQWVGEPNLDRSRSYILSVNQIALRASKTKSGVQVVSSFGVVINVAPPQGQPAFKLVAAGIVTDAKGKRHPTFTVENASNVHGALENAVVHLTAGSWSKTYEQGDINQKVGIGIIQPGKRRIFTFPDVLPAGASKLQASLDYKPSH